MAVFHFVNGHPDLEIDKGYVFRTAFKLENPDGSPVLLDGCSADLVIKAFKGAPDSILHASSVSGEIVIDPASGLLSVELSPVQTGGITVEFATYVLSLTGADGIAEKQLEGDVIIKV